MRKNIFVEFTNERIILSGGFAVVGAILGKSDFVKRCNRMKVDCNHTQHQIKNGDIMLAYIGMQYSRIFELRVSVIKEILQIMPFLQDYWEPQCLIKFS